MKANDENNKVKYLKENIQSKIKLNPSQLLFVKEYVSNYGNGTKAYLLAYPGVTYDSARALSAKLLTNANIKNAIAEEYNKIWEGKDSEIEKSKTYLMIHALSNSDITDIIEIDNGNLRVKPFNEIPISARQAIQSIEYNEKETQYGIDRRIRIKLHPKLQALELRAKLQGMLDTKNEFSGEIKVLPADRQESVRRIQEIFNETNE